MTIRQPSDSYVLSAGNGTQTTFSFPFAADRFEDDDVFVYVWNGSSEQWDKKTVSTHYSLGTNLVTFTSGNVPTSPPTGISANVLILRKTDIDEDFPRADFQPGSSIRAQDLDANQLQALRGLKELRDQKLSTFASIAEDGTPSNPKMFANLDMGGFRVVGQPAGYVTSTDILDGTIVNADISGSAAIEGTKINPNFGSQDLTTTGDLTVNDIAVSGNVDGRDVATDGAKLDGIEAGATGDQTNAEIRAAVEAATDSNVFTDADHAKLNAIEAGATADQTATEIKSLYESNADTNVFDDGEKAKLAAIETQATRDQTGTEIKALYEGNADTNAFTDADHTKLDGIATGAEVNVQANWTETDSSNDAFIRNAPDIIAASAQATHTPSDTNFLSSAASDARYFRQDSTETITSGVAWAGNDTKIATTGAIDARIVDLVEEVGGFVPIANETSFPAANPDVNNGAGTIVSVSAISTSRTPSSGTVTIANGAGTGNTVTITGVGTQVLTAGFGMLLETTSTLHTYAFHRLAAPATNVNTVATNITSVNVAATNISSVANFADVYQVSAQDPTTRGTGGSVQEGDLYYNTAQNVMKAYNGTSFDKITPDSSQLNDIAVVANDMSTFDDLGSIADALVTGQTGGALETCADNISDIQAVENAIANVNAVAGNAANVNTVAGISANVTTVAGIAANVTTVAGNNANVSAVAGNATNINTVAGNNANVTKVAAVDSDVTTVAGIDSNVTTVAGISSNVTTVSGVSANVTTVSGIAGNVTTVANNDASVTTVAGSIANVNTVGSSIADVNRYAQEYVIQSGTPSSPSAGDLWYNTTSNTLNYYSGSSFVGIAPGIASVQNDSSPVLGGNLNANNRNITNGGTFTATSFVGALTGNATGLSGTPNITVGTIDGSNLTIDFGTL